MDNRKEFEDWAYSKECPVDTEYADDETKQCMELTWISCQAINDTKLAEAKEAFSIVKKLHLLALDTIIKERATNKKLLDAAQAVVTQWETPNWKLTENTGTFIYALRDAIAEAKRE